MARTSNLTHRIERLLNDSRFRQAFAGGRRRALLAVLLVPLALFVATAVIRVEAAQSAASPHAAAQATGQSMPDQAADQAPAAVQEPIATPAPADAPSADVAPQEPPAPPEPPSDESDTITVGKDQTVTINNGSHTMVAQHSVNSNGVSYHWSTNGDSYAVVTGPGDHFNFSGNWNGNLAEQIEKARKLAHGKFLWFTREGKSYVVEDPSLLAPIELMYQQMGALGEQQEALGREQEELGKEQEKLGRQQERASIPTPDISKEMAELNEAVAKLQAKKGNTVSEEELANVESKIGQIQGRLGDLQGKIGAEQGRLGGLQGQLGAQQGELGAKQGRLGAQQGRIGAEADRKVKSIIDQSLKNGTARPLQ